MKRQRKTFDKWLRDREAGIRIKRLSARDAQTNTRDACATRAERKIIHSRDGCAANRLDDFARDGGVFVERVGGAKAMVAVGDDGLGGRVVPDEKERR